MIYMENAYKNLEDNRMGTCVYLGVTCKCGTAQCNWEANKLGLKFRNSNKYDRKND